VIYVFANASGPPRARMRNSHENRGHHAAGGTSLGKLATNYPRRESNPHLRFRKPLFYPLNYGDTRKEKVRRRKEEV
jgi:hypothetical protein